MSDNRQQIQQSEADRQAALGISLFSGLTDEDVTQIMNIAEVCDLRAGDMLIKKGEENDCLYFLLSGRLGVFSSLPVSNASHVYDILPGEVVGEISVLSQVPRSANVCATRDCRLGKLARDDFMRVAESYPKLLLNLATQISDRLAFANAAHTPKRISRIKAVVSLVAEDDLAYWVDVMQRESRRHGYTAEVVPPRTDRLSSPELAGYDRYDMTFLVCRDPESRWSRTCMRQADELDILVPPQPDPAQYRLLEDLGTSLRGRRITLFRVHEASTANTEADDRLNKTFGSANVWNLRSGDAAHERRLGRIQCNRTLGIVFSGGGAKGCAYIGAIRALRDMHFEFDYVGGCSIGAVFSGSVLEEYDDAYIEATSRKAFLSRNPLGDWTVPLVSISRGNRLTSMLRMTFGDRLFEQCWIKGFCVATNLSKGRIERIDQGRLRLAIRASISLPALAPPVERNGDILIDGGLLNNFPVDEMKKMGADHVLALNLGGQSEWRASFNGLDPEAPLLRRWRSLHDQEQIPTIGPVLVRSMMLGNNANFEKMRAAADVLIDIDATEYGLLEFGAMDALIKLGEGKVRQGDVYSQLQDLKEHLRLPH
ncbi:MAG: patatin-like phospholipase family protein [Gammaproteobacteria bacterium]|nr:patatin-like phospholipase family protein [Gammaproteobacteria bacterium]NNF61435.1 cyclic nucleotide-binding domain-containing protein [Gammaproteobacteria bacterium]NNM20190.1 cyclic nucleotide-binding domain-containing protein [Gammaproteobacteria bacterium]